MSEIAQFIGKSIKRLQFYCGTRQSSITRDDCNFANVGGNNETREVARPMYLIEILRNVFMPSGVKLRS